MERSSIIAYIRRIPLLLLISNNQLLFHGIRAKVTVRRIFNKICDFITWKFISLSFLKQFFMVIFTIAIQTKIFEMSLRNHGSVLGAKVQVFLQPPRFFLNRSGFFIEIAQVFHQKHGRLLSL